MSEKKTELPYPEIYEFYEGLDHEQFTKLSGQVVNTPLQQLLENDKVLADDLNNLSNSEFTDYVDQKVEELLSKIETNTNDISNLRTQIDDKYLELTILMDELREYIPDDLSEQISSLNTKIDNLSSSLARVATTGNYNDLSNKPTIPNIPSGSVVITSSWRSGVNFYRVFSDGFIEQGGGPLNFPATVNLHRSFSSTNYIVMGTRTTRTGNETSLCCTSKSTSSFYMDTVWVGGGRVSTTGFWLAMGY